VSTVFIETSVTSFSSILPAGLNFFAEKRPKQFGQYFFSPSNGKE
jgi:hypothetical protein